MVKKRKFLQTRAILQYLIQKKTLHQTTRISQCQIPHLGVACVLCVLVIHLAVIIFIIIVLYKTATKQMFTYVGTHIVYLSFMSSTALGLHTDVKQTVPTSRFKLRLPPCQSIGKHRISLRLPSKQKYGYNM